MPGQAHPSIVFLSFFPIEAAPACVGFAERHGPAAHPSALSISKRRNRRVPNPFAGFGEIVGRLKFSPTGGVFFGCGSLVFAGTLFRTERCKAAR